MRVRITSNAAIDEGRNGALPFGGAIAANVAITEDAATLTTGELRAELRAMPREIVLPLEPRFPDRRTGAVLLEEEPPHLLWPGARQWEAEGDVPGLSSSALAPIAANGSTGWNGTSTSALTSRGCVLDLVQKNTGITIPFLMSSRRYGLLWNRSGIAGAS